MTYTATDLFCGCGGSSEGAEAVAGVRLRMGANHWKTAIETHSHNFPHADHDLADISQVDPRRFPSTDILLASPECTHHSRARTKRHQADLFDPNGDPAAERSRATMWDVPRFAEYHKYKLIVVENVTEIRNWAPFAAWIQCMDALGYDHQLLYLNSMIAPPTPQSRDRFYGCFWRKGNRKPNLDIRPKAFCEEHGDINARQTWKKPGAPGGKYGARQQYFYACPWCRKPASLYAMPAASAIDFSIPGVRIGDRVSLGMRPLAEATRRRVQLGLERFGPAIIQRYGNTFERPGSDYIRAWPTTAPLPTQMTDLQHGIVVPLDHLPTRGQADRKRCRTTTEPFAAQTGRQDVAYVDFTPFIAELRGGGSGARSTTEPMCTVTAKGNHHAMVTPPGFFSKAYGDGTDPSMNHLFEEPLGTVTTQDHHSVVRFPEGTPPHFLASYYGHGTCSPVRQPIPTIRTHDSAALVNPGIVVDDCDLRMLRPSEVQAGMGIRRDYHLVATNDRDKVKMLGNGVTPPIMTDIVGRLVASLEPV